MVTVKPVSCLGPLPSTCSAWHLKLQFTYCLENFQCQASSATLSTWPGFLVSQDAQEDTTSPQMLCPAEELLLQPPEGAASCSTGVFFCGWGGIHWSLLVWGRWRAVDLRLTSSANNVVHIKHFNSVHPNHTNTTSSLRQNFSLQRCISSCREDKKLPSPAQKGTKKQYQLPLKSHSWNQEDWKEESKTKSQRKNGVRKGKKVCEEKANYKLSTDSWLRWRLVIFLTLCFPTVCCLFSGQRISPSPESDPYP